MNMEIERKWLMDGFPPLPELDRAEMEQAYLHFLPTTVRVRKAQKNGGEPTYRLTIKGKGGLARTEVELPIDSAQYEALLPLATAPPARKQLRRYALPGGLVLECSLVDEGEATSFYYAEVEFEAKEQAYAFVAPAYLGQEVTEDQDFTMAAYCRRKGSNC
jgi:CYTH domain-containing protein